jgi:hypothetical protein
MRRSLSCDGMRRYAVVVMAVCGISVSALPGVSTAARAAEPGSAGSVSAVLESVPGLWW